MREIKFRGKRIIEPIKIERYAPDGWMYGDLPEYAGSYLVVCGDESLPEYDVDFYENFWNGKRWVHNEGRIIAWTEIPKYE